MESPKRFKRYLQTRRFTGRRGITPIKTRQKRIIPKTHRHRVEDVPIHKHPIPQLSSERKKADKGQYSEDSKREGNQGGHDQGKREDTKEPTPLKSIGNQEDTKESVHPGTLQEVQQLSEQYAFHETSDKTEIEAEELL